MPDKPARITVRLQPRGSRDEVLDWQEVPGETGIGTGSTGSKGVRSRCAYV